MSHNEKADYVSKECFIMSKRNKKLALAWTRVCASAALVCAASLSARGQAQTTWATAVDGSWSDADKWSAGVPNVNTANLTAVDSSYTVTVDAPANPVQQLKIENNGSYVTRLDIAAPFAVTNGTLQLYAGALLNVANNGVMTYRGPNTGFALVDMRAGAEWQLNGGSVDFSDLPTGAGDISYFYVGYGGTNTARLTVNSGTFRLQGGNTIANLAIGNWGSGIMRMNGGTAVLSHAHAYYWSPALSVAEGPSARGELTLTNDATLIVSNTTVSVAGNGHEKPYGSITVAGNARLWTARGILFGFGSGAQGFLTVSDNAVATIGEALQIGGVGTGVVTIAGGVCTNLFGPDLGCGAGGEGILNVYGGRFTVPYGYGINVGIKGGARGTLNITNGVIETDGWQGHHGLTVGKAGANVLGAYGVANISGGAITNNGQLGVGVCLPDNSSATGVVYQSGGIYRQTTFPSTLGWNGGMGTYNMSGGTFRSDGIFCVGGIPTDFYSYSVGAATNLGVGVLNIQGGTFSVSNTLWVGAAGAGTVTIGSNAVCGVANLVLTNSTQSTLRFELGAAGSGALAVSGALSVYPGARLEVDSTAYSGSDVWIKLAECATRAGSFAPENITVIGKGLVRQDRDEDLWLYIPRGTLISIQ